MRISQLLPLDPNVRGVQVHRRVGNHYILAAKVLPGADPSVQWMIEQNSSGKITLTMIGKVIESFKAKELMIDFHKQPGEDPLLGPVAIDRSKMARQPGGGEVVPERFEGVWLTNGPSIKPWMMFTGPLGERHIQQHPNGVLMWHGNHMANFHDVPPLAG